MSDTYNYSYPFALCYEQYDAETIRLNNYAVNSEKKKFVISGSTAFETLNGSPSLNTISDNGSILVGKINYGETVWTTIDGINNFNTLKSLSEFYNTQADAETNMLVKGSEFQKYANYSNIFDFIDYLKVEESSGDSNYIRRMSSLYDNGYSKYQYRAAMNISDVQLNTDRVLVYSTGIPAKLAVFTAITEKENLEFNMFIRGFMFPMQRTLSSKYTEGNATKFKYIFVYPEILISSSKYGNASIAYIQASESDSSIQIGYSKLRESDGLEFVPSTETNSITTSRNLLLAQ